MTVAPGCGHRCDYGAVEASEPGDSSDLEIVASQTAPVRLWKWQLGLWVLLFSGWGWQAVAEPTGLRITMATMAGASVVMYAWMLTSGVRVQLVLAGDTLHLKRPLRPLAVARSEILAVGGDVPGRPTWSQQVVIKTRAREIKLPAFDLPPAEVIARLQSWAGVDEDPAGQCQGPRET